jgi:hypothetical protein
LRPAPSLSSMLSTVYVYTHRGCGSG